MSDEPDRSLFAVVTRQRACREFAATPVTDADLAPLLEAATHAPSAENKSGDSVTPTARRGDGTC